MAAPKRFVELDSPLETRDDVFHACVSLLEPLKPHFSPGRATVKLGNTAVHYDETGAQLEGFARPLWGLAPLLAGGYDFDGASMYLEGLRNGTDPDHQEFWGYTQNVDQRMVEMCPLAFALIVAPSHFWEPLSSVEKENVTKWFACVNHRELMNTNWLWFRVFANLALASNRAPYSQERLESDLNHLDTFYRGDGWSNDGPGNYTQMDYYSGSFAIQFAQLLYVKTAAKRDPKRCDEYKERARLYAQQFVHYFDEQGRAVAFGRSLTYRFAMAGFWSAIAFADVELPAPFTWGVVKGLLLRNLRWWSRQADILTPQGTLSIGFTYPNQFMTENYNSPGSPYWFMLGFAALALPASHPFWTSTEESYPSSLPKVVALERPMHIMVNSGGHRFLLSSGQLCHYAVRAAEAKYGKFAYSSAFGYSVPTGSYNLESIGHDNMIALSDDKGETWKQRKLPINDVKSARLEAVEGSPVLISSWNPWPDVQVESFLLPPTEDSPNWHLRVHHITSSKCALTSSEGAFAIHGTCACDGRKLPALNATSNEGQQAEGAEAVAVSEAGCVGIVELLVPTRRSGTVLAADANSNLVSKRCVLPALSFDLSAETDVWLCTAVFAIPASAPGWTESWRNAWSSRPAVPKWVEDLARGSK